MKQCFDFEPYNSELRIRETNYQLSIIINYDWSPGQKKKTMKKRNEIFLPELKTLPKPYLTLH